MRFSELIWQYWSDSEDALETLGSFLYLGAHLRKKAGLGPHSILSDADGKEFKLKKADIKEAEELLFGLGTHPSSVTNIAAAASRQPVASGEDAHSVYEALMREGVSCRDPSDDTGYAIGGENVRGWVASVTEISIGLWAAHPAHFVPYLYLRRFDEFRALCEELGIAIPPPPGENSWDKRARYYLELNDAMLEFAQRYSLEPHELAAFLDDFGAKHLAITEDEELPEPRTVWWLHGGTNNNGDGEFLDAADAETTTSWQGNDQARRGDIAVMYCLAPRSHVHSVWRVVGNGHYDPFSYFSRVVQIGCPVVALPRLSFRELAADTEFSKWPAVNAHFQGASGRALPPPIYNALVSMYAGREVDVGTLPKLEPLSLPIGVEIEVESDVEERARRRPRLPRARLLGS